MKAWLAIAFIVLPETPVYSVRSGEGILLAENVQISTFDWLGFSALVLGRKSTERLYLLTWARVDAKRRIQEMRRSRLRRGLPIAELPVEPAGGSITDFCDEFDIRRSTFDRSETKRAEGWWFESAMPPAAEVTR